MDGQRELLNDLKKYIGCPYLSDLYADEYRALAIRRTADLPAEAYPLKQWVDAAIYLTGRREPFERVEQVKAFFAQYT